MQAALNTNSSSIPQLYNPKAYAPALYIPAWLIQVPNNKLNYSSKLVYGRLAQWATSEGKAHRSAAQLSQELGMPIRTVERSIQELRDKQLLGTYVDQNGGHNHFKFYDHTWMHEAINDVLCYKTSNIFPETPRKTPSAKMADPSAKMADPSAKMAVHKIKEIKEIKEINNIPVFEKTGDKKNIKDYQQDERFMRFYNCYPKKEDPRDAWKAFKALNPSPELLEKIIADIECRKKNHTKWQDRQYIKHPAVYLRKGEYEGEIFNAAEESNARKEQKRTQGEAQRKELELLSQKRADEERMRQQQFRQESAAWRNITDKVKSASQGTPAQLKALKQWQRHQGF